jgi:hypothetical protein
LRKAPRRGIDRIVVTHLAFRRPKTPPHIL